jgi:hypothetical protein
MAFADAIVTHSQADVVIVDRRHRPGGHWNDAYPFVRLHSPSANYGVNSVPLGDDSIDDHGLNAGLHELASAASICDYFTRVLDDRLIPTGRVRFLGMHDYETDASGRHRLVSRLTGAVRDVTVGRKVVDATYLRPDVPATHTPSFQVDPGVRIVPINRLTDQSEPPSGYTIIGAGKTAMDACLWLLGNHVDPGRIRWIMPRDAWLFDRAHVQPLSMVASMAEAQSRDLEAVAQATSVDDLFRRLELHGRLLRIDPAVTPTMFHCATVSQGELEELRRIRHIVRLGRVRRIGTTEVVLDRGTIPGDASHQYVDCSATGISRAPAKPIFEPGCITLQMVRSCQPTFNAALIGYIEATRKHVADQNRLCPVNPYPDNAADWLGGLARDLAAMHAWSAEPDVLEWLENSRLNLGRGMATHLAEPLAQEAGRRRKQFLKPALDRLPKLMADAGCADARCRSGQTQTGDGALSSGDHGVVGVSTTSSSVVSGGTSGSVGASV